MINIINKRYWFFLVSGIAIVASIVFLAVFGLKPGIDFSSGSAWTISFPQPVDGRELSAELDNLGYSNFVQTTGTDEYLIRTARLSLSEKAAMKAALDSGRFGRPVQLVAVCGQHFPTYRPAYREIYYRDRATGGGAIQDAITHVLNLGEWLIGPVDRLL